MIQHGYHIDPINFRWSRLETITDFAAALFVEETRSADTKSLVDPSYSLSDLVIDVREAKKVASIIGWEGGMVGGDGHVFWIPQEGEMMPGLVWKQSNNGSTFVLSPAAIAFDSDIIMQEFHSK